MPYPDPDPDPHRWDAYFVSFRFRYHSPGRASLRLMSAGSWTTLLDYPLGPRSDWVDRCGVEQARLAQALLEHRTGQPVDPELVAAFVVRPGRSLARVELAELDVFFAGGVQRSLF